jgi:hypothetical protein
MPLTNVHKHIFPTSQKFSYVFSFFSSTFHQRHLVHSAINRRMASTHVAASAYCSSGNRGLAFTDFKINNILDIMGEIILISLVNRQKVLFSNKNRDIQSLH